MKWIWKRRLKSRWLRYQSILSAYNCGAALAEYMSPRLAKAKSEVNEAIRKCRELDTECDLKEVE